MKIIALFIFATWMTLAVPIIAFGDGNEPTEEAGEVMGWLAIALTAVPIALYPAKKAMPTVIRKRKELRKQSALLLGLLRKLHIPIGITIFLVVAGHGFLFFLDEGGFDTDVWIGTTSFLIALIGGIVGAAFAKRRKAKSLRYIHISLLITAGVIAGIHVLLA